MLKLYKSQNSLYGQFVYLPLHVFNLFADSTACLVNISKRYSVLCRSRLCEDVNLENVCIIQSPVFVLNVNEHFEIEYNSLYNSIQEKDITCLYSKKPAAEISVSIICQNVKALPVIKNDDELKKKLVLDILEQYLIVEGCIVQCDTAKYSKITTIIVNRVSGKPSDVYEINSNTLIKVDNITSLEYYNQITVTSSFLKQYKKVFTQDSDLKVPTFTKLNRIVTGIIKNSSDCCLRDRNLLIVGPSGCGKTILVRAVAKELKKVLLTISCRELKLTNLIESLKSLVKLCKLHLAAKEECVILIKHIDNIGSTKNDQATPYSVLIGKQIKLVLEDVLSEPGISVIATSSSPENILPDLRSFGCFNQEIEIPMLTEEDRGFVYEILSSSYCLPGSPIFSRSFAKWTVGYVFADILLAMREAYHLMRQNENKTESEMLDLLKKSVSCNMASTLRGTKCLITANKISFDDIGGLEGVKKTLRMCIQWQMENPEAFARLGVAPTRGVLLFGPPGCAKTTLVKALANETNMTFIAASAADIYSPYVGEAEKKLAKLFMQARIGAPAIIFIDEIDSLVGSKDGSRENGVQERILATLLMEMDGVGTNIKTDDALTKVTDQDSVSATTTFQIVNNSRIIVVGATNRVDKIDEALKRPGRFDKLIYISPPTRNERLAILMKLTSSMALAEDVDLNYIADETHGFSGADLKSLCTESALFALTTRGMDVPNVTHGDFLSVLKTFRCSLRDDSSGKS